MKKEKAKLPPLEETILMNALGIKKIAESIKNERPLNEVQMSELNNCIDDAEDIANSIINVVYPDTPETANEVAEMYGLDPIPLDKEDL